jgi:hypothetical protein
MRNGSTETNQLAMNDPCVIFTNQRIKIASKDKRQGGLLQTFQNPSSSG